MDDANEDDDEDDDDKDEDLFAEVSGVRSRTLCRSLTFQGQPDLAGVVIIVVIIVIIVTVANDVDDVDQLSSIMMMTTGLVTKGVMLFLVVPVTNMVVMMREAVKKRSYLGQMTQMWWEGSVGPKYWLKVDFLVPNPKSQISQNLWGVGGGVCVFVCVCFHKFGSIVPNKAVVFCCWQIP